MALRAKTYRSAKYSCINSSSRIYLWICCCMQVIAISIVTGNRSLRKSPAPSLTSHHQASLKTAAWRSVDISCSRERGRCWHVFTASISVPARGRCSRFVSRRSSLRRRPWRSSQDHQVWYIYRGSINTRSRVNDPQNWSIIKLTPQILRFLQAWGWTGPLKFWSLRHWLYGWLQISPFTSHLEHIGSLGVKTDPGLLDLNAILYLLSFLISIFYTFPLPASLTVLHLSISLCKSIQKQLSWSVQNYVQDFSIFQVSYHIPC